MTPISTATSSDARLPNPRISFTARYFSGYRLLLRLAVRRERIIAPVTVIIFVILDLATAASIASMYPTAEKRRELAAGPGANSAFRFLLGDTIHIDSTASAVVWRAGLFMIAAVGVCAVLMVVRGTRKEEELGRVELIRAGVVGPLAPLAAAATVAAAFSVVVGLAMSLVLIPFGGGGVAVLVVFAQYAGTGLAAVGLGMLTAQVAATSHIANLVGSAIVVLGYLLRGVPDATGGWAWLRWVSPVGWAELADPFGADNLVPFMASLGLLVLGAGSAAWVSMRRDLGGGIIAPRAGPEGTARIPTVEALAARLSAPLLRSWAAGLATYALVVGFMQPSVEQLAEGNDVFQQVLTAQPGDIGLGTVFAVTMLSVLGVVASAWVVNLAERLRAEEAGSRTEVILATPTSRGRYFLASAAVAALGLVVVIAVAAAGMVIGNGIAGGGWVTPTVHIAQTAAVLLPAALVIGALVLALYAFRPVLVHLGWPIVVAALFLGPLSGMFELPQWVCDISPFTHVPLVPVEPMRWLPIVVMALVSAAIVAGGWSRFRWRDVG
ncbi:ABC transporter permease [Gordonia sp. VNK1]|uniref:ABC transporter permease n=1 Tax=Gordonia oleivorans TaxID=3156618 RepID=UPI0032B47797